MCDLGDPSGAIFVYKTGRSTFICVVELKRGRSELSLPHSKVNFSRVDAAVLLDSKSERGTREKKRRE